MVTLVKFQDFAEQLGKGTHEFVSSDRAELRVRPWCDALGSRVHR